MLISLLQSQAQKPVIDTSTLGNWPAISEGSIGISADGKFIIYNIINIPSHSNTLVLQSINGTWKREWVGGLRGDITDDSRFVIVQKKDSISIISLETLREWHVHGDRYTFIRENNSIQLLYLTKEPAFHAMIRNLSTAQEYMLDNFEDFISGDENADFVWIEKRLDSTGLRHFIHYKGAADSSRDSTKIGLEGIEMKINYAGRQVIFTLVAKNNNDTVYNLYRLDRSNGRLSLLFESAADIQNVHVSDKGERIIFMIGKAIYFSIPEWKHIGEIKERISIQDKCFTPVTYADAFFSRDRKRIFFKIMPAAPSVSLAHTGGPVIWRYDDELLKENEQIDKNVYWAVYNIENDTVIRLEQDGESFFISETGQQTMYLLLWKRSGQEWWWRNRQRGYVSLIDIKTGSRDVFNMPIHNNVNYKFDLSPDEKYLIYYNPFAKTYFSYKIASRRTRNLSKAIQVSWYRNIDNRYPDPDFGLTQSPVGLAGWIANGKKVLIYDEYDIWEIDPSGRKQPICITGGYGRQHHIPLTLVNRVDGTRVSAGYCRNLNSDETVILRGIDPGSMQTGLFSCRLDKSGSVRRLLYGAFSGGSSLDLIKAADTSVWILRHSSAGEAPNLFVTTDWTRFQKLTDISPHTNYNWYTAELVTWTTDRHDGCRGILYKPEDFDPKKKYPIIFNYYEQKSMGLNQYHIPAWMSGAELNIPYFVSNGYLIFLPDISIRQGYPGKSALDIVVSAARHLIKEGYIDSSRMGLIGHSFGGFETNYIIAHSNLFAAAVEGAGPSDLISMYGSISRTNIPEQWVYELGQFRIGADLWERQDLYRENSPVLYADRVTTPLLILHNKNDQAVPFEQSVEWFTALRRLKKSVWLLNYEGEGHGLSSLQNKKDFTIRVKSFFDHYLQGKALPEWMQAKME